MLISIDQWHVTVDIYYDHNYPPICKMISLKFNDFEFFISYLLPMLCLLLLSHGDIEFNPEKGKKNKQKRTKTIFILSLTREWFSIS